MRSQLLPTMGRIDACPSQVLRYIPGQRYEVHPDFFDPRDREELANGGQRIVTCLLYLSTLPVGAGGATWFPEADTGHLRNRGLRVRPVEGRAIIFHNTLPDGSVDHRSVHAGETVRWNRNSHAAPQQDQQVYRPPPPEKWLLSKWVRQRPYHVDAEAGFP